MIEWEYGGMPDKIGKYLVCSIRDYDGVTYCGYDIVYWDGFVFDNYDEMNDIIAFTKINRP